MAEEKFVKSAVLNLEQVFNKGKNCFQIPDYQRAYSWESLQRNDFMSDIENIIYSQGYKHYTGTIVAEERGSADFYTSFDIIDGQQRLTTIIILLSVLAQCDFVDKDFKSVITEQYLFSGRESGNTIRLFKLNGGLDNYFYRKLEQWNYTSEEHTTKAHANLDNAFTEFKEWLDGGLVKDEAFAGKVYKAVTSQLGFLFYIPESNMETGLMFEVINNRGKKLSELEKIKNYIIYYSEKAGYADVKTAVDHYWGKILSNLNACGQTSNEQENSFLRYTWIVFQDRNKSESHHVYENLKYYFPAVKSSSWIRLKEYIEFLDEASLTYNKLLKRNLLANASEKKVLQQIAFQTSYASVIPMIMAIYARVKDTVRRVELLSVVEKLNFRYYGCGIANRSDTGNGHLFWLAYSFYNSYGKLWGEIRIDADWLKSNLVSFIDRECDDETLIKYLTLDKDESGNFHSWNNLKFYLANYEESLAIEYGDTEDFTRFLIPQSTESKNINFEKEHILAGKERSVFKAEDDLQKRRLGNFVLLKPSVNKSIQNDVIFRKIAEYANSSHKYLTPRSLAEIGKLYGIENVNKGLDCYTADFIIRFLDKREEKLLNFALKRWGIHRNKKVIVNSLLPDQKAYRLEPIASAVLN